jgi:hypothetical protein
VVRRHFCFKSVVFVLASCGEDSLRVPDGVLNVLDDECWNENFLATCDPRSPEACDEDTTCAIDYYPETVSLACVGPPPIGDLDAPCDASSGCKPPLMCNHGVCGTACCSEADCPAGQHCGPLHGQLGSLGTCGG